MGKQSDSAKRNARSPQPLVAFAICSETGNGDTLQKMLDSIRGIRKINAEVVLDQSDRPLAIKRIETIERALRIGAEYVVVCADYLSFSKEWWEGFCKFGLTGWDVALSPCFNLNGHRYKDWCFHPNRCGENAGRLASYDRKFDGQMFVNHHYFVMTNETAKDCPLSPYVQNDGGDSLFFTQHFHVQSKRVVFNPRSRVELLVQKDSQGFV